MTEKRCHICGNEVRKNYYLDKRGYTCYTCSKTIARDKMVSNRVKEKFEISNNPQFVLRDIENDILYDESMTVNLLNNLVCLDKLIQKKDLVTSNIFASGFFAGMEQSDKFAIERIEKYAKEHELDMNKIQKMLDDVYRLHNEQ